MPIGSDTTVMGRAWLIGCSALCQIEKFTVSPPKVSTLDTKALLPPQHAILHMQRAE